MNESAMYGFPCINKRHPEHGCRKVIESKAIMALYGFNYRGGKVWW